jgi:hypothetical protein
MKLTVELDLDNPHDAAVAEDLVTRKQRTSAPVARRRRRPSAVLPPLTPDEAQHVSDLDRKRARSIADEKGFGTL